MTLARLSSWRSALGRGLGRHYPYLVLAAATLAVAGIYLEAMLSYTGGRPAAPLDDAYIYFNYARHMAAGYFLNYNPGDGTTTGATSLLWTPILALGNRIGFDGDAIVLWAMGLNAVFLFLYGTYLYRIGRLVFSHRLLSTLIALLILIEGRVLWGFFSGMEIGLYHLSLVATLYYFAAYQSSGDRRPLWGLVASLGVLVLVRPEGHFLAGFAVVVFVAWKLWTARRERGAQWLRQALSRQEWLVVLVPVGLILLTYLLYYLTTGQTTQQGMRLKSHLFAPDQTIWGVLKPAYKFYRDMVFRHFPWLFDTSLRHVMDVFLFLGFLFWTGHEVRHRRPGLFAVMGLWFFGGLAIQSVVLNAAYHHGRYQMNYTFVFWLVFFSGLFALLSWIRVSPRQQRFMMGGAVGLFLLMMPSSIVKFRHIFANDCKDIQDQHVAMGEYIAEHTPPEAVVAINDAGAIAYHCDRPVYDIYGLTTAISGERKWDGQACIFEQIMHLEPDRPPRRPDHFAIYDIWYPDIVKAGFLTELHREFVAQPSICGGEHKILYSIDWDSFGDKSVPQQAQAELEQAGLRVIDSLDLAHRPEEIAHDYAFWRKGRESAWGSDLIGYGTYVDAPKEAPIVDGGRRVREREAFTVQGIDPGRALLVIRRTRSAAAAVRVRVDGRDVGIWPKSRGSQRAFRDEWFTIEAEALGAARARLELEVVQILSSPDLEAVDEEDPGRDARLKPRKKRDKSRPKKRGTRKAQRPPPEAYEAFFYWFAQ